MLSLRDISIGMTAGSKVNCRTDLQMEYAALAEEVMIPIRLDIDLDSFKIKDAFMWNMNGLFLLVL